MALSFGQRLKKLREEKGLTQSTFAELLLISDKTISKWEKDKSQPDFYYLSEIAKFFNVSIDYLIDGKEYAQETGILSDLEIACRDDNISMLEGIDISNCDEYGKDIYFYIKKYNSKNIQNYLLNFNDEKDIVEPEKTVRKYHVLCGIPADLEGDENLKFIYGSSDKEKIQSICFEYAKEGYHDFQIYRELSISEIKADYQLVEMCFIDTSGELKMDLSIKMCDDMKTGMMNLGFFKAKENNQKKDGFVAPPQYFGAGYEEEKFYIFVIQSKYFKNFLNTLEEVNFKDWESCSWGYPICRILCADKEKGHVSKKYYVSPGKEKYHTFVKALQRMLNEVLPANIYEKFNNRFTLGSLPFYRRGMSITYSWPLFKEIEKERN